MKIRMAAALVASLAIGGRPSVGSGTTLDDVVQRTYRPETRPAAIAALDSLLVAEPHDPAIRRALARALSWSGRLEEALAHYDVLLRGPAPRDSVPLAIERLRVRLWQGELAEAEQGFEEILRREPGATDALVGLAQIRRWSGRPLGAWALAERAVGAGPDRQDAREELAWARADLGLGRAARRGVEGLSVPGDLDRRIRQLVGPMLHVMPLVSEESFDVARSTVRAVVSGEIPGGVRVEAGGGHTRLARGGSGVEYVTAAGSAELQQRAWSLHLSLGIQATRDSVIPDALLRVLVRVSDRFRGIAGLRRRLFLEGAEPLEVEEGAFYAAGAGGATDLPLASRLGVDEARLQLQAEPMAGSYAYGDLRGLRASDENLGYAVAAGFGLDLARAAGRRSPIQVMAHWDGYWAGYREARAAYYSLPGFDSQGLGVTARWQSWARLGLFVAAGRTLSFSADSDGWFGGGGLEFRSGPVRCKTRVEIREDPFFDWRRAWLSLSLDP
jgi:hypothetical protein